MTRKRLLIPWHKRVENRKKNKEKKERRQEEWKFFDEIMAKTKQDEAAKKAQAKMTQPSSSKSKTNKKKTKGEDASPKTPADKVVHEESDSDEIYGEEVVGNHEIEDDLSDLEKDPSNQKEATNEEFKNLAPLTIRNCREKCSRFEDKWVYLCKPREEWIQEKDIEHPEMPVEEVQPADWQRWQARIKNRLPDKGEIDPNSWGVRLPQMSNYPPKMDPRVTTHVVEREILSFESQPGQSTLIKVEKDPREAQSNTDPTRICSRKQELSYALRPIFRGNIGGIGERANAPCGQKHGGVERKMAETTDREC